MSRSGCRGDGGCGGRWILETRVSFHSVISWLIGFVIDCCIVETREKDPEKRKGRLHRAERDTVFSSANAKAFVSWVWVWMK